MDGVRSQSVAGAETVTKKGHRYGTVLHIQEMRFGRRTIAPRLHNPDMLKLAEAYGLQGIRAKDPGELRVEVPVGLMPQIETAMGKQAQAET